MVLDDDLNIIRNILSIQSSDESYLSPEILNNLSALGFPLPRSLQGFYTCANGWDGFLGKQYFCFFNLEESFERTFDLGFLNCKRKRFVFGDNGASEIFFVKDDGVVFIADQFDLQKSQLRVANSFLDLVQFPNKVEKAFS
jgi:hypothetical protein